jgi:hypothetical protein
MNDMDLEEKILGLKNKVSKSKSESKIGTKNKSKSKKVSFEETRNISSKTSNIHDMVNNRNIDSYVEKLLHTFNIKGGSSGNNKLVVDKDTTGSIRQKTICGMIKTKFRGRVNCATSPDKKNPLTVLNDFNNIVVYNTSGSDNNCLLHSFFMVTSELYRNLSINNKNKFINTYREYLINNEEGIRFGKNDLNDIKKDDFLNDNIAVELGKYFGVCILFISIVQTENQGNYTFIVYTDLDVFNNMNDTDPVYIIYNINNIHFSGVGFKFDYIQSFNITKQQASEVLFDYNPDVFYVKSLNTK